MDRHGRAAATDTDRRKRPPPGYRAADMRRFTELAEDALADLPSSLAEVASDALLVVEEFPPQLSAGQAQVALAAFDPSPHGARLVVYRQPLQARAYDRGSLSDLIVTAMVNAIADALGLDPEEQW